jgi:hypothetical protein
MAVWALVEAQNSSLNLGDARGLIGDAIVNGVESILTTQQKDLHGLLGWWPNPSVKNHHEYFAGLTAQTLYVLARAQAVTPTLRANHRINDVIRNYLALGLDGAQGFEVFSKRNIDFNEQVEASDRYFEGRPETARDGEARRESYPVTRLPRHQMLVPMLSEPDPRNRLSALPYRSPIEPWLSCRLP